MRTKLCLTLADTRVILAAARAEAEKNHWEVSIAVVDDACRPIGLVVTLFMLIALVFLIRSMNKHLRKVPPTFDPAEPEGNGESGESADEAGTAPSGSGGAATAGSGGATDRPPSSSSANSTPKS